MNFYLYSGLIFLIFLSYKITRILDDRRFKLLMDEKSRLGKMPVPSFKIVPVAISFSIFLLSIAFTVIYTAYFFIKIFT